MQLLKRDLKSSFMNELNTKKYICYSADKSRICDKHIGADTFRRKYEHEQTDNSAGPEGDFFL